jgi:hypothetical protein
MNRKHQIEARLERSLTSQLRAPRLDGRFDAGVWARIEAEQQASARISARPNTAAAWLRASNTAGMIVAGILVVYFGFRLLSGVEVALPTPEVSVPVSELTGKFLGYGIAAAALLFGLMLTPMGRRLRTMLS